MNSLIEKRNDAGASSRPVYFEDCRKRPKRQRGNGFFHEPTPNVFALKANKVKLERIRRTPLTAEWLLSDIAVRALAACHLIVAHSKCRHPSPEDDSGGSLA